MGHDEIAHESRQEFVSRMIDQLALIRARAFPRMLPAVLAGIGRHLGVSAVHFYIVRGDAEDSAMFSLVAQWSADGQSEVPADLRMNLKHEAVRTFVGPDLVSAILHGAPVFTSVGAGTYACSRLLSAVLRDLELSGYDLIPVLLHRRIRGMIGLAHNNGGAYLQSDDRGFARLIGRLITTAWIAARKEVRRRSWHRQWKSVADGACDFAIEVSECLMITEVTVFRWKRPSAERGMLLQDFVSNPSPDHLLMEIRTAVESGVPGLTEFRSTGRNGLETSYAVRIEPGHRHTRGYANLYLTSNDRERQYSEEITDLRTQLERSARLGMLGNVATEFAHQLAQPLQAVSNLVFTVRNRITGSDSMADKQRVSLQQIEDCLEHASDIITGVRNFLRNKSYQLVPVNLVELLAKAVNLTQHQAETAGIKLQLKTDVERPQGVEVLADSLQTLHVLLNLIINAIEAVSRQPPESPRIRLSCAVSSDGQFALIRVHDNGPGVPPELIDQVFERFFTTREDGFGVGLALCRDIIERQHGTIRVTNNHEGGCSVTVSLPVIRSRVSGG